MSAFCLNFPNSRIRLSMQLAIALQSTWFWIIVCNHRLRITMSRRHSSRSPNSFEHWNWVRDPTAWNSCSMLFILWISWSWSSKSIWGSNFEHSGLHGGRETYCSGFGQRMYCNFERLLCGLLVCFYILYSSRASVALYSDYTIRPLYRGCLYRGCRSLF